MANTLTDVMPKILAIGLQRLRKRLVMPRLVNTDFSPDTATRGNTVNIPVPPSITTRAVSPDVTPTAAPAHTQSTVPIALDQWYEAPIVFTDKERLEVLDRSVQMAVEAAADALAERVNASIMGLYDEVYSIVGTAGTTPFTGGSPNTYAVASEARKVLNTNKAPMGERRIVVDPDAEEAAINLSEFADSSFAGSPDVLIEGDIGRKLGFDWFMDQQVPSHTAGSITTGAVAKAATNQALGTKAVVCTTAASTGAVDLKKGDIITFAGDSQTYVVTADVAEASAASDFSLNIEPGLKVALEGGEDLTLTATHVSNLAFHRDAFAIAVRQFLPPSAPQAQVMTMVDQATGLPLRLEVTRQNRQDYWAFDLLWGVKSIRPELAVRIAG